MKKTILVTACALALLLGFGWPLQAQKKQETPSLQDKDSPKVIAVNTNYLEVFSYDAGKVKFIASSEDTNGAWSLVELTEIPGYHTNLHRHNHTSEAFYVLEGVLTVKINDKTTEYQAGSYVLIPPGTAHAQGNRGKTPVRVLLTMTPGGFERSFKDRVELFKTIKPENPDFRKMREELTKKSGVDVERLANWDLQK